MNSCALRRTENLRLDRVRSSRVSRRPACRRENRRDFRMELRSLSERLSSPFALRSEWYRQRHPRPNRGRILVTRSGCPTRNRPSFGRWRIVGLSVCSTGMGHTTPRIASSTGEAVFAERPERSGRFFISKSQIVLKYK